MSYLAFHRGSAKTRAIIFAMVTAVVLVFLFHWRAPEEHYAQYPAPNVLGSTWYGPVLLLLIPVFFGWVSLAFSSLKAKVAGFLITALLTGICGLLIVQGLYFARPTPMDPNTPLFPLF